MEAVVRNMLDFYKGKRVLLTGHTGFKGSWLAFLLAEAGAEVTGYSLPPRDGFSLYELSGIGARIRSRFGDIRDGDALQKVFDDARPELVFHLAAQPIVTEGYRDPVGTYSVNVMGTVQLLDCVRRCESVRSVLNVTTDKVYRNRGWAWGYRETDELCGGDPYANSKSCSELVTDSYCRSFLNARGVAVSTARAGNVIGGGDFAEKRIIPDCVRAVIANEPVRIRNPYSVRPYQHVLEALSAYLLIAQKQSGDMRFAGSYNIGPQEAGCVTTGELASLFCRAWGGAKWINAGNVSAPHEDIVLRLDCAKLQHTLGWRQKWSVEHAVDLTVEWTRAWRDGGDIAGCMRRQLEAYYQEG